MCTSPFYALNGDNMNISILGFSIFKCLNIDVLEQGIVGYKIVVLSLLSLTLSYGESDGDHLHIGLGFYKLEIFGGLTLWS
jgi:hypothetical protein